ERVRDFSADRVEREDHLVVSLALLQTADREDDGPAPPAQSLTNLQVARRGAENGHIDAGVEEPYFLRFRAPNALNDFDGIAAVGDEQIRSGDDAPRQPEQLAALRGAGNLLAVDITEVRKPKPAFEKQRHHAFG